MCPYNCDVCENMKLLGRVLFRWIFAMPAMRTWMQQLCP
jgi:hypothetical protein